MDVSTRSSEFAPHIGSIPTSVTSSSSNHSEISRSCRADRGAARLARQTDPVLSLFAG